MENPNYKIDEIFRQRLHDAEVPPPPFVWPAVEQALHKRRRRLLFLWMFAFTTVFASVWWWQSGLWTNSPLSETDSVAANLPKEPQTSSPLVLPESPAVNTNNAAPVIPETRSDNPLNTGAKPALSKELKVNEQTLTSKNTASAIEPLSSDNAATENSVINITADQPEGNDQQPNAAAPVNPLQEQKINSVSIPELLLDADGMEPVVSYADKKDGTLPLKSFKPLSRRKKAKPKFCYDFTRHPSAWLIDAYAGPSLAQRSLTSRLDDEPYLNQRLATERRSIAMNGGLRASLMFNGNFLVRTGLHYDHVTEVFEYIDPTTVIYRLKFTPGNPIPDTLGVEYGENYLKTYNRYGMLDLPVMVGVEMRHGRSGFSINAGVTANILFQKSGVIIDPNIHEPVRFGAIPDDPKAAGPKVSVSEDVFRTNVGLSAVASIQWYWHLSSHFRLFAEPSFRQLLRPVTVGSHPVEQRYSILGLRLGATRIF